MKKYVGIPYVTRGRSFTGADCYGLVWLYYFHEYGISLPLHSKIGFDGECSSLKQQCEESNIYRMDELCVVEDMKRGDILLLNVRGFPIHAAIVVNENRMLHTSEDTKYSVIVPIRRNKIESIYRNRLSN